VTQPNPDDILARSLSPGDLPPQNCWPKAKGGNRDALEELVRRYQDGLQRIVRIQLGASPLRRHYDSMDIVQSTFRAALPKIGELEPRGPASLLNWLAVLATNQIRDAYDRHRAAKRDAAREVPIDRADHHAADSGGPGQRALMAEVRDLLDEEVARLPQDQRRVVILRGYCGGDWENIARRTRSSNWRDTRPSWHILEVPQRWRFPPSKGFSGRTARAARPFLLPPNLQENLSYAPRAGLVPVCVVTRRSALRIVQLMSASGVSRGR
jgi:RNA polymerase sigma factor (sigma-70 family)